MAMILVCGEALIDLFVGVPERAPGPRETFVLHPAGVAGGSPFNVAIGLARLQAPSAFLGGLSGDGFGRFLRERLEAEEVYTGFAKASAWPTPLAIISTAADGQPTYSFHAENCAEADLRPDDLPAVLDGVEAIALGSFSLILEPVGSTLLALAEREADKRVVSLDPNIRLGLIGDLAAWRTRFDRLVRTATIIKASEEDLLAGYGGSPPELAQAWQAGGTPLVVLTQGADGATAFHASGTLHVPAVPVQVVDTVGAGDTFHAALLSGLHRRGRLSRIEVAGLDRETLRAVVEEAAIAAAITCSRRGADLPTAEELLAALARLPDGAAGDRTMFAGPLP